MLFFSHLSFAQDFRQEFDRLKYIQNLENIASYIDEKNNIKLNTIVLDSSQLADFLFIDNVSVLSEQHKKHFLISTYTFLTVQNSNLSDKPEPVCIIAVNYNNRQDFLKHANRYSEKIGQKLANDFVNYALMAHELGHCLARQALGANAISESYADAIGVFLIKNSPYQEYVTLWINELQNNTGDHNTYMYVKDYYENIKNVVNLIDALNILKGKK